jgi:hypothetical protein
MGAVCPLEGWIFQLDLTEGFKKDTYPVELADYAIANQIQEEPAFAWWVPYVIRKRTAIISKLRSKYWQKTHKYGIRVPRSINEAKEIDIKNVDNRWMDAVRLEMENVRVTFEIYNGDTNDFVGYQKISGHLVFDVKLGENFHQKARYCADGHKTKPPASISYYSVAILCASS